MTKTQTDKTSRRELTLQEYIQWLLDNEPEHFYAYLDKAEVVE